MTKPKNIVFIMSDDHAAKAISAYGAGINHTPHMDRIAKNGMRFDHCYVTNSICTPSRATILTGVHNHVNGVLTLASKIDSNGPNVAKHLRSFGGYQTAMFGKWHLGEGPAHEPSGFDAWEIVPGQGVYFDPEFISPSGRKTEYGYATDIITDKTIDFIDKRDESKPFFVMPWYCDPKLRDLYKDEIKVPETCTDDYKNRAAAAAASTNRVAVHLSFGDLDVVQQPGDHKTVGPLRSIGVGASGFAFERLIPMPDDPSTMSPLIDVYTGEKFTFKTKEELAHWKYQRYVQKYLRTIHEHGWYDKRFIYEESFQMPFLACGAGIPKGAICKDIVSNVDFAPTWLEYAGIPIPSNMQGESFLDSMLDRRSEPQGPDAVAYHRYWMNEDENNNVYAHYGIRDKRYKLIFWYNRGYDLPGTRDSDFEQEWELFDLQEDPLELFNLWSHDKEGLGEVKERMLRLLEAKMLEIGDTPAHPFGLPATDIQAKYAQAGGAAAAGKEHEHNL